MPKSNFPPSKAMGDVIRRERYLLGLHTQRELADRLGNVIQPKQISFVESGRHGLSNTSAQKLMELFECDEFYLRGESPYKTEEERNEADVLDEFDMSEEKSDIVTDAISIVFGWKQIGTVGMCFKLPSEPPYRLGYMDSFPCCFGTKVKRHIPDGYVYRPQYYIFDTPDGKCAVPFMAYLDFTERVFSFIYEELDRLADHVPVIPGWERYVLTDYFGRMADNTIERFFDVSAERNFDMSISEWEETISGLNRQQDSEEEEEQ